jgi:hypothetical protein
MRHCACSHDRDWHFALRETIASWPRTRAGTSPLRGGWRRWGFVPAASVEAAAPRRSVTRAEAPRVPCNSARSRRLIALPGRWRRTAHGARRTAHGARRSAHGARRTAHGARRTAHGARRTAHGARRTALGARRSALGRGCSRIANHSMDRYCDFGSERASVPRVAAPLVSAIHGVPGRHRRLPVNPLEPRLTTGTDRRCRRRVRASASAVRPRGPGR